MEQKDPWTEEWGAATVLILSEETERDHRAKTPKKPSFRGECDHQGRHGWGRKRPRRGVEETPSTVEARTLDCCSSKVNASSLQPTSIPFVETVNPKTEITAQGRPPSPIYHPW